MMMMYEYMDYENKYSDDEKRKKENFVVDKTDYEDRIQDMKERGRNILVHDYNGEIITLSKAKIWYNSEGDYVETRKLYTIKEEEEEHEHVNYTCLNLQKILMKIFCINTKY